MNPILVDTDVIIDFLRGNVQAKKYFIANINIMHISGITMAELFAGVREGSEKKILEKVLGSIKVIHIDNDIAKMGGLYKRDFRKSHNVSLADAIIAATAEIHKLSLKTFNIKHFPMIKTVAAPYKKL